MPQRINLPDGTIAEFPDDMPTAQIEEVLRQQFDSVRDPKTTMTAAGQGYRLPDSAEAPGTLEQLAGGFKHGWDRAAYGLEKLVTGEVEPSHAQDLRQGRAFVKDTGMASTVGQMGAEALATAPIGVIGQMLTKAVPALRGASILSARGVGRAAAESAAASYMLNQAAPAGGEANPGGAAVVGGLTGALPLALGAAGKHGASVLKLATDLVGGRPNPLLHRLLVSASKGSAKAPPPQTNPATEAAILAALRGLATTSGE